MLALLLLPTLASAADDECFQSLTEFDIRTLVRQSNDALFRDDVLTHKRLYGEFTSRVPCLATQLPKDAWAQMLVNEAIVRNATGGDWVPPLTTALEVYPEFPEVPEFLLETFAPPPPVRYDVTPVPEDATLFVDGELSPRVPIVVGLHVLQLWRDGEWRSRLVDTAADPTSGQVPPEWLIPKPEKIREVQVVEEVWKPAGRGVIGAGLGLSVGRQMIEEPGKVPPATARLFLGDNRSVGVVTSVGSFGVQPIAASAGLMWDLVLNLQAPTLRSEKAAEGGQARSTFEEGVALLPSAYVGAAAVLEGVHVGIGGGFTRLPKVQGDVRSLPYYPQPHLAFGVRNERADFELGGGLTPAALHAGMRGGWLLSDPKALSWRLGFETGVGTAWFTEAPPGDEHGSVLQVGLLARLDATWGRDR